LPKLKIATGLPEWLWLYYMWLSVLVGYVLLHLGPDRWNKLYKERKICSGAHSVFVEVEQVQKTFMWEAFASCK